ncbi:MAG: dihydropteroate synthase, partial [Candidatus Eisenbacteria bacterium]|nr:dihydropteroate synthase [Candidatus Eisenbacteria bacterium]
HMQGNPAIMQREPRYEDCARDVAAWLSERLDAARRAGIGDDCVALDPGVGFGKTARHSLELIARLDGLAALGRPVLLGASRKSFIGHLTGAALDQRLEGGLAAHAIAVFLGARVIRTHDVAATARAVAIANALSRARR